MENAEDRQEHVRELFLLALELPDSKRVPFLNVHCGDDVGLQQEILALLQHHRGDEDRLLNAGLGTTMLGGEQLSGSLDPPDPDDPDSTSIEIDSYKVLQTIGQGGMGRVYMAEQTHPVRRRVALKVIVSETPTKEILARFEAERQALALMDHQNIAKVLDAGKTKDGRPYFAMELVKGVPITKYCDDNKLTPNLRLELFIQTCRAIQHAHTKGIVHRDIKPSNVLVTQYDGKPTVKVIDFGLAKALQGSSQLTERTLFTKYGQVVGTLAYMSPEQAEFNALDVDTRTDVYSLGVILYELLTGSTPITSERIRKEAFDRILALIREEEPPRPSQRLSDSGEAVVGISQQRQTDSKRLGTILRGDLDWIAVKALEKDRTRRYDTAASLANDVERYLQGEAIQARPPSLTYRTSKAISKNIGLFASACALLMTLVAGLIGTGSMWYQADHAQKEATRESNQKTNALNKVTEERNRANQEARRADAAAKESLRLQNAREWQRYKTSVRIAAAALDDGREEDALNELMTTAPSLRSLEFDALFRRLTEHVIASGIQEFAYDEKRDQFVCWMTPTKIISLDCSTKRSETLVDLVNSGCIGHRISRLNSLEPAFNIFGDYLVFQTTKDNQLHNWWVNLKNTKLIGPTPTSGSYSSFEDGCLSEVRLQTPNKISLRSSSNPEFWTVTIPYKVTFNSRCLVSPSGDSALLYTAVENNQEVPVIIDLGNLKTRKLSSAKGSTGAYCWSKDGNQIINYVDRLIKIYDVSKDEQVDEIQTSHPISELSALDSSSLLILFRDGQLARAMRGLGEDSSDLDQLPIYSQPNRYRVVTSPNGTGQSQSSGVVIGSTKVRGGTICWSNAIGLGYTMDSARIVRRTQESQSVFEWTPTEKRMTNQMYSDFERQAPALHGAIRQVLESADAKSLSDWQCFFQVHEDLDLITCGLDLRDRLNGSVSLIYDRSTNKVVAKEGFRSLYIPPRRFGDIIVIASGSETVGGESIAFKFFQSTKDGVIQLHEHDISPRKFNTSMSVDAKAMRAVLGFHVGDVDIVDLRSGKFDRISRAHVSGVYNVHLLPGGEYALSAGTSRSILWNVRTSRAKWESGITGRSQRQTAPVVTDSRLAFQGNVWDLETGEHLLNCDAVEIGDQNRASNPPWFQFSRKLLPANSMVPYYEQPFGNTDGSVQCSPDAKRIVAANGRALITWDAESGLQIGAGSSPDYILDMRIIDNQKLAYSTTSGNVVLWNYQTAEVLVETKLEGFVATRMNVSTDGKSLTCWSDNAAAIVSLASPSLERIVVNADLPFGVLSVTGGELVACSIDERGTVYRGRMSATPEVISNYVPDNYAISNTGLLAVPTSDREISVIDLASGEVQQRISTGEVVGKIGLSNNGMFLVAHCVNNTVMLFDIEKNILLSEHNRVLISTQQIHPSDDGTRACYRTRDGFVGVILLDYAP